MDSLLDDYTKSWTAKFADAFDSFRESVAKGSKTKYDEKPDEYWSKYGLLTRSGTDRPETIERRHQFFVEKMYALIDPRLKDPTRIFGEVERELIYYRDRKRCQLPGCGAEVVWSDAQIHHVEMHSSGGSTTLDNGALVHAGCHPKSVKAVAEFAESWRVKLDKRAAGPTVIPRVSLGPGDGKQVRRGRPRLSSEDKLVAGFIKLGLSEEAAREVARKAVEDAGKPA